MINIPGLAANSALKAWNTAEGNFSMPEIRIKEAKNSINGAAPLSALTLLTEEIEFPVIFQDTP